MYSGFTCSFRRRFSASRDTRLPCAARSSVIHPTYRAARPPRPHAPLVQLQPLVLELKLLHPAARAPREPRSAATRATACSEPLLQLIMLLGRRRERRQRDQGEENGNLHRAIGVPAGEKAKHILNPILELGFKYCYRSDPGVPDTDVAEVEKAFLAFPASDAWFTAVAHVKEVNEIHANSPGVFSHDG